MYQFIDEVFFLNIFATLFTYKGKNKWIFYLEFIKQNNDKNSNRSILLSFIEKASKLIKPSRFLSIANGLPLLYSKSLKKKLNYWLKLFF